MDREQVSGAVNLVFAGRPLTNAYRNLTNVVLRIAPRAAAADALAVLVNSHFDSVFGTRGAPALVAWHGLIHKYAPGRPTHRHSLADTRS